MRRSVPGGCCTRTRRCTCRRAGGAGCAGCCVPRVGSSERGVGAAPVGRVASLCGGPAAPLSSLHCRPQASARAGSTHQPAGTPTKRLTPLLPHPPRPQVLQLIFSLLLLPGPEGQLDPAYVDQLPWQVSPGWEVGVPLMNLICSSQASVSCPQWDWMPASLVMPQLALLALHRPARPNQTHTP